MIPRMATSRKDACEILGIPNDADQQQIKARYRELARRYHPDTNAGDKTAEWTFKQIANAYARLQDPESDHAGQRTGWEGPDSRDHRHENTERTQRDHSEDRKQPNRGTQRGRRRPVYETADIITNGAAGVVAWPAAVYIVVEWMIPNVGYFDNIEWRYEDAPISILIMGTIVSAIIAVELFRPKG